MSKLSSDWFKYSSQHCILNSYSVFKMWLVVGGMPPSTRTNPMSNFSNSQLEGKSFFGGKFEICKTFDVGKRFFFSNFMTIGRFDICAFSHFIMNAINKAYIRWPFL